MSNHIGTLNEKPLHAALKTWYEKPGDQFEVKLGRFVIDIKRDDLLIEIQTRSFSAMKRKLRTLLQDGHQVRLVHPIATEKWILKKNVETGEEEQRRKSPKKGTVEDVFTELVSFPKLMLEPEFSLEVILIQEEEIRHYVGRKAWRKRGWATEERRLLSVVGQHTFKDPADFIRHLPPSLPETFTTHDLAKATGKQRTIAQRMAYCLREMAAIEAIGKKGRSILYRFT
ncbi:MAG: hypothetical protein AAF629_27860 [Chloroflexota bacterium]